MSGSTDSIADQVPAGGDSNTPSSSSSSAEHLAAMDQLIKQLQAAGNTISARKPNTAKPFVDAVESLTKEEEEESEKQDKKLASYCSRVSDFIFEMHCCGDKTHAALSISQTETVRIRKICRELMHSVFYFGVQHLIATTAAAAGAAAGCPVHLLYMHSLAQCVLTLRTSYGARRGFIHPSYSSNVPETSDEHIARWVLNLSAALLEGVFEMERASSSSAMIETRVIRFAKEMFESVIDLLATEQTAGGGAGGSSSGSGAGAGASGAASGAGPGTAANAGLVAATVSPALRAEAKACIFQTIQRAHESAPLVFSSRTSSSSSSASLPLLISPFLRVVGERMGADDEGQLACVKIMSSVIADLCHDENGLLIASLDSDSVFRFSLARGLVFSLSASQQPLVVSAALETLSHLSANSAVVASFALELGELYCGVLLRLLDSALAPNETRVLIATHLRRLAVQNSRRTGVSVLADFALSLEMNPKVHHLNFIQQTVSVLSKIVRQQNRDAPGATAAAEPLMLQADTPLSAAIVTFFMQRASTRSGNVLSTLTPFVNLSQPVVAAAAATDDIKSNNNNSNSSSFMDAATTAAAETQNVTLECFKTLCCITHALSFAHYPHSMAVGRSGSSTPLARDKSRSRGTSPDPAALAPPPPQQQQQQQQHLLLTHEQHAQMSRELRRIAHCLTQGHSFGRSVDVINHSPLKGIMALFKIPVHLLKLPSDMKKTAAEQAEEAALESALQEEEQRQKEEEEEAAADNEKNDNDDDDGASANKKKTKRETTTARTTATTPQELAAEIASLLMGTPSISMGAISEFLSDPRPIANFVAEIVFSRYCDIKCDIYDALTELLAVMNIPKEGQRIERLLERFAASYWKQNQAHRNVDTFPFENEDACFLTAVAVVMLNTDMHNPQITSKMTQRMFGLQLSTANNDGPFPPGFTDRLFAQIRRRPMTSSTAGLDSSSPGGGGGVGSPAAAVASSPAPGASPASSPISDFFFFSRNERRELQFSTEKRRIVLECLMNLRRRIENPKSSFALDRKILAAYSSSSNGSSNGISTPPSPTALTLSIRAGLWCFPATTKLKVLEEEMQPLMSDDFEDIWEKQQQNEQQQNPSSPLELDNKKFVSLRSVSREALSLSWSPLAATMSALLQDASQPLAIAVAAASCLASLLHGAAAYELQSSAPTVLTALLRARSRTAPLHDHIVNELLGVAQSTFSPNLGEDFWGVVVPLAKEASAPEQVDAVFRSLSRLWPSLRPSQAVPLSRVLADAASSLVVKVPASSSNSGVVSPDLALTLRVFERCILCLMEAKARINATDQYLFVTEWPTVTDALCELLRKHSSSSQAALGLVMKVSQNLFSVAVRLAPEVVGPFISTVSNLAGNNNHHHHTHHHNRNSSSTSIAPATQILIRHHVVSLMQSIVSDPRLLSDDQDSTGMVKKLLVGDFLPVLLEIIVEQPSSSSSAEPNSSNNNNNTNTSSSAVSGEVELKGRCAQVFSSAALNFCATDSSDEERKKNLLLPVCAMLLCATAGATDSHTRESCLVALKKTRVVFPAELSRPLSFALAFTACSTTDDSMSATAVEVLGSMLQQQQHPSSSEQDVVVVAIDLETCYKFIVSLCCFVDDAAAQCEEFVRTIKSYFQVNSPAQSIIARSVNLVTLLPSADTFCKSISLPNIINQIARSTPSIEESDAKVRMFRGCLRHLIAVARTPHSAVQAAQALPLLFAESKPIFVEMLDVALSDCAALLELLLSTFLRGRPAERIEDMPRILTSEHIKKLQSGGLVLSIPSPLEALAAVPVSPTEESVAAAFARSGVCPVLSLLCEFAKSTLNAGGTDTDVQQQHILLHRLSRCFDVLLSLSLHVPSLMHTSAPPTVALQSLCPSLVAFSINTSSNKNNSSSSSSSSPLAGRICEVIFRSCMLERVIDNAGLKTVFFTAASHVGKACMQLVVQAHGGSSKTDDTTTTTTSDDVAVAAHATWKLIHSAELFEAVTRALRHSKLNSSVANFLDAFRYFELEVQQKE